MSKPVRVNSIVQRIADPEKQYQVLWFIKPNGDHSDTADGARWVRLCPADTDAKMAGARRCSVMIVGFWRTFEEPE